MVNRSVEKREMCLWPETNYKHTYDTIHLQSMFQAFLKIFRAPSFFTVQTLDGQGHKARHVGAALHDSDKNNKVDESHGKI